MNKNHPLLFVSIFFILVLSSCGLNATENPAITQASETAYPASSQLLAPTEMPGYPVSTATGGEPATTEDVVQDPAKGSVSGILFLNGKPLTDVKIYLAPIVKDDQGRELVAGYDRTGDLQTAPNAQGNFVFQNVIPGRYGLVLDLVNQAYLLDKPDGSESIIFTVEANKETSLGKLEYKELPGL